jgi:hypothetical protein
MGNASSLESWILVIALFAALGAWVTAVVTFIAWKRSQSLETMWQLIETWMDDRLVSCRSRAAERILNDDSRRARLFPEAIEILDIFELLSYLVIEGTYEIADEEVLSSRGSVGPGRGDRLGLNLSSHPECASGSRSYSGNPRGSKGRRSWPCVRIRPG